jgi:hypothetical protein
MPQQACGFSAERGVAVHIAAVLFQSAAYVPRLS